MSAPEVVRAGFETGEAKEKLCAPAISQLPGRLLSRLNMVSSGNCSRTSVRFLFPIFTETVDALV